MNSDHRFPPEYYRKSTEILETSLAQLGAYRGWRAYDPGRGFPIDTRYEAMPALTKQDIREHFPDGLVPPGRDVRRGLDSGEIQMVGTSGSSDTQVTNIWNQEWWDASEKASWNLNSHAAKLATGTHREAILANPRNVGFISDDTDLPCEKRRLGRFLYLNEKTDPTRWTASLMDRMINELETYEPAVLEANPSLLARLCRYADDEEKQVFQPGLIVFTYEYLSRLHYRHIRKVFSSPTASSYGTTETGYVLMQCEAGKFHLNSDFCRVDFLPLKAEHGGPLLGKMLVTTFDNSWYYIVHFDVGDLARLDEEGTCPCGRDSGFIVSAIEGRQANLTLATDGRLVTLRHLDDALNAIDNIDEYSLEQTAPRDYTLYLVTRRHDKERLTAEATELLLDLYGKDAYITVVYRDAISPEDSGKYCLARTLFPLDMESYLDRSIAPK
jgi:phenylacetate-coenzyme A ligase PaaK-like adenylate-forming protein